ncbi:unnamed protein product [Chondrus crispus]|uniref:PWWP domain-containing protein n=1 Tax=Chondrus crispus TaxID=2769 RepID=R7QHW1_CHOCR|nr:unnamed protein product [Chondrus crispus]CDF36985.1 unnamed protein product [Chondrus crispus]|eukprot:XP_005716804.1 unnamed protein product [Chondrus crispus]
MTGVEASEIRLGVAVFGRVSGFPWWPAVVSKCEPSGEWRKDGKFWVRFFNDHTGSWLKSSEIRSFDDYNTDRCLEHNHKVPKFRRYSDRVYKACSLAEKYISSPKRIRIRVLGPRGTDGVPLGDEQEVISISAADAPVKEEESDPSGHATEHRKNNYARSGKSAGKRKRNQPSSDDNSVEEEPIENKPTRRGSKSTAGEERTKRKRVRSLRYVEYMSPMEARMAHRQIGPNVEHNGKHSHNDTDLGLLDYSPPMGLQSEAERHLRRPKTNDNPGLSRKLSLKSSKTTSERSTEKRRVSGRGSLSEGSLHILPKKVEPKLVKPASERSEESQDASTETRRARSLGCMPSQWGLIVDSYQKG